MEASPRATSVSISCSDISSSSGASIPKLRHFLLLISISRRASSMCATTSFLYHLRVRISSIVSLFNLVPSRSSLRRRLLKRKQSSLYLRYAIICHFTEASQRKSSANSTNSPREYGEASITSSLFLGSCISHPAIVLTTLFDEVGILSSRQNSQMISPSPSNQAAGIGSSSAVCAMVKPCHLMV